MSRLCVTDSDQSNSAAGFLSRHQHIPHFYSNHFHSAQTFHFKSGKGRLCSPKRMNFQKGFKWRHCCNNVVPWKKEYCTMKNRYQQLTPFRDLKWTSSKIGLKWRASAAPLTLLLFFSILTLLILLTLLTMLTIADNAGWPLGFYRISTTPSQNGQLSTDFYFFNCSCLSCKILC